MASAECECTLVPRSGALACGGCISGPPGRTGGPRGLDICASAPFLRQRPAAERQARARRSVRYPDTWRRSRDGSGGPKAQDFWQTHSRPPSVIAPHATKRAGTRPRRRLTLIRRPERCVAGPAAPPGCLAGGLVPGQHVGRDPAAAGHLQALSPSPGPHVGLVMAGRPRTANRAPR
jgi:hypothetical protein